MKYKKIFIGFGVLNLVIVILFISVIHYTCYIDEKGLQDFNDAVSRVRAMSKTSQNFENIQQVTSAISKNIFTYPPKNSHGVRFSYHFKYSGLSIWYHVSKDSKYVEE